MSEQFFYGHGKLLLTGEYIVMDGAKAIALPTHMGQSLSVKYRPSNVPKLYWKSLDHEGKVWFEASFDPWHFDCADNDTEGAKFLTQIFREVRKQNIHFLRENQDTYVETRLEFNLQWGLGSSSTLLYNIAQWAYVSPFELAKNTMGGSGYDIAAAQSMGPITYQIKNNNPNWETCNFNPWFKDKLFFVYTGRKKNTSEAITAYKELNIENKSDFVKKITKISNHITNSVDLKEFELFLNEHENLVSSALGMSRIQNIEFADYDGVIKSLGAWGGDFFLATSAQGDAYVRNYFQERGLESVYTFDEMILTSDYNQSTSTKSNENLETARPCH